MSQFWLIGELLLLQSGCLPSQVLTVGRSVGSLVTYRIDLFYVSKMIPVPCEIWPTIVLRLVNKTTRVA
jgi:hypothetical protein